MKFIKSKFKYRAILKLDFWMILIVLIPTICRSDTVYFENKNNFEYIGKSIFILEDPKSELSLEQILESKEFRKCNQEVCNLGMKPSSTFWVKFSIHNLSDISELLLEINDSFLNEIELYTFHRSKKVSVQKISTDQPFSKRKYLYPTPVFELIFPQNKKADFLLKVRGTKQIVLPIRLMEKSEQVREHFFIKHLIFGIFSGLMLIMFFYNLFIYFTVKDRIYLYYILHIFCAWVGQITIKGFAFKYLWPNVTWLETHGPTISVSISSIAIIWFMNAALKLRNLSSFIYKVLNLSSLLFMLSILLSILDFESLGFFLVQTNSLIMSFLFFYIAIKAYVKGYRPAKLFLFAWSILLIGVIMIVLKDFNILPYSMVTYYTLPLGVALEALFLSFVLADRINIMRHDTEMAQQEKQKALEKQLKTAQALDQTQSELIKTARLASMGRTIARIAHELNAPIYNARITAQHIATETKELLETTRNKISGALKNNIEECQDNIENMSSGLITSIDRAAKLVSNFRQISADQTNIQRRYFKLKDYINTTVVSHEVFLKKKQITVTLTGHNPIVYADSGFIYQVIQNLLTNTEKYGYPQGRGAIDIHVEETNNQITITYKDYGKGIAKDMIPNIFRPFYTTGEEQGGIGLGLSIVHSVVTDHLQGTVTFSSLEDKGVTFIIILDKKRLS